MIWRMIVSKVVEKVVASRLNAHPSTTCWETAHKKFHTLQTALLTTMIPHWYHVCSGQQTGNATGEPWPPCGLRYHQPWLFGVQGLDLSWFDTYLLNRHQTGQIYRGSHRWRLKLLTESLRALSLAPYFAPSTHRCSLWCEVKYQAPWTVVKIYHAVPYRVGCISCVPRSAQPPNSFPEIIFEK